jgi:hypothetical protein
VRSLLVIAAAAGVFVLFLVRHERAARDTVRAEDSAIEHALALAAGPRGPPRSEGGYRFEWKDGGDLPALLIAAPDGVGVSLFAAAPGGAVYALELFDEPPPDVTPLRIAVARGAGPPAGWRQIR